MRWLAPIGLILAASLAACSRAAPQVSIDPLVSNRVLAAAAEQVRPCYRSPRVASQGKQIVTRLRVRLNADGTLAELPAIISQSGVTPTTRPYAARMAEAASLAIIRCAPLRLPAEHYGGIWNQFELMFSPSTSV